MDKGKGSGYPANAGFGEGTMNIKEGPPEKMVEGTAPTSGNPTNSSGREITSKTS